MSRFYCDVCDFGTNKKSTYDNHLKSKKHHIKLNSINLYYCQKCDNQYSNKSNYMRHLKEYHEEDYEKEKNDNYYLIKLKTQKPLKIPITNNKPPSPPPSGEAAPKTQISNEGLVSPKCATDIWYDQEISDQLVEGFIQGDLIEYFNYSKKSSKYDDVETEFTSDQLKFIKNWQTLKSELDKAFDEANNWDEFLVSFKPIIIHIKSNLYTSLHQKLQIEPKYMKLIKIFKQFKSLLIKCDSKIWYHQNTRNIVDKMTKF